MNQSDHLLESFYTTLGEWPMMMVSPCPQKDFSPPQEKMIKASIDYDGPVKGIISLVVADSWTEKLAHHILGIPLDKEIPPGAGHSAISELINIVCGQFLNKNYSSEIDIQIGLPEIETINESDFFDYEENKEVMELISDEEKLYCRIEAFESTTI